MRIKGFDKDLCCKGMQFAVGKEYDTGYADEDLKLCSNTVFHYCESLQKVNNYYSCDNESHNRFCEIEVLGKELNDGEKCGSNKIKIVREIVGEELNQLKGLINGNTGLFNTGNRNTGDCNSGDRNTGFFNKCNNSTGIFCTEKQTIRMFNKPSNMTLQDFFDSPYYDAIISAPFHLTYEEDGEVKSLSFEEACQEWWSELTDENKKIIQQIPNFDKDIFFEITGIELPITR